MNRIMATIGAGTLLLSAAACSTPVEQAIGGAVVGGLAGAGMNAASFDQSEGVEGNGIVSGNATINGGSAGDVAGGPDYGAKKPHDHCGNGTMVHLGRVICSP